MTIITVESHSIVLNFNIQKSMCTQMLGLYTKVKLVSEEVEPNWQFVFMGLLHFIFEFFRILE